ncbi:MAG: D-2-hydroxyacid dehydrogenase [Acidobacteriota bacterium]
MKLVVWPPIEAERLEKVRAAAGSADATAGVTDAAGLASRATTTGIAGAMRVVNCSEVDDALREIADADGFFGKMTPELLASAKQLRWIQSPTASLEHYLFPALIEHPCTLTNMRGLFSDVIADQVMGYVICFARNLHLYMRRRKWQPCGGEGARVGFAQGPGVVNNIDKAHLHLSDCTLGVVGCGEIGAEVARRARAFSMPVLAVDPVRRESPCEGVTLWGMERLNDLLAQSRFVVICAPHTPETARMFSRALIQKMNSDGFLINIGRGAIVVLDDLVAALEAGEIAGAALDVFETEPLPEGHSLWAMENVILTPHVAGFSPRISERHLAVLLENVKRFARGEPLTNVVDKQRWF